MCQVSNSDRTGVKVTERKQNPAIHSEAQSKDELMCALVCHSSIKRTEDNVWKAGTDRDTINVHLQENYVGKFLGHPREQRGNHLARPAPGCSKVNTHLQHSVCIAYWQAVATLAVSFTRLGHKAPSAKSVSALLCPRSEKLPSAPPTPARS